MNEVTKLAIRERINTLAGDLIELERQRETGADPARLKTKEIWRIEDEIEALTDDLAEAEDANEDADGETGTITVNLRPEIDTSKIKEAFAKINSVL